MLPLQIRSGSQTEHLLSVAMSGRGFPGRVRPVRISGQQEAATEAGVLTSGLSNIEEWLMLRIVRAKRVSDIGGYQSMLSGKDQ
jgi:hypothetical protein